MFKKGPIQLQTEITTDEELDDFLAKEGIAGETRKSVT